jgi:radical SAM superfamily enzyme YgiQ (UPF0313 family)
MHKDAVQVIQKWGMKAKVYIITGLPGETDKSIEATKKFVLDLKPDKWICLLFTPYPGTPIYMNPDLYGVEIIHKRFREYVQSYPSKSHVNLFEKGTKKLLARNKDLEERFEDLYHWLNKLNPESMEYSSFNG